MTNAHAEAISGTAEGARASSPRVAKGEANRWHDPLGLIRRETPEHSSRIVLWAICLLVLILILWAAFGKLDIIATADGKLVTQTLVKIVQPAEPGVVKELLVEEGDRVKKGQVIARLDTTLAKAEFTGVADDLATQLLQERRLTAQLADRALQSSADDDPVRFAQVLSQFYAQKKSQQDSVDQEQSLLTKAEHEMGSATDVLHKLQQTLPIYNKTAEAYAKLEKDGYMGNLASADKHREAVEKARDLDAQARVVGALAATLAAQKTKIQQLKSSYRNGLETELANVRARIQQLKPTLEKNAYRTGLMELRAPQDGVIKELSTTTVGAVVQPGTVIFTLVPSNEQLYADVAIKNDDVGFVQPGQAAQIKLAAYPFQRYGMLTGTVIRISADASEASGGQSNRDGRNGDEDGSVRTQATYKARVKLHEQQLVGPDGAALMISPGMQVVSEIHQGRRTVLEYLLSPVLKVVQESSRER